MNKTLGIALGIMCAALIVIAGTSGVENPVNRMHQPGLAGSTSTLQAKIVEFNDDVVTSLDAVTAVRVQKGTFTNGTATVTFGTAFSDVPKVVLSWNGEDISGYSALTNVALSAITVTTSNFVPKTAAVVGDLLTNAVYIAVGSW